MIEVLSSKETNAPIFARLDVIDNEFSVNTLKKENTQIDTIVVNKTDETLKIIECKWKNSFGTTSISSYCNEVKGKKYEYEDYQKQY